MPFEKDFDDWILSKTFKGKNLTTPNKAFIAFEGQRRRKEKGQEKDL